MTPGSLCRALAKLKDEDPPSGGQESCREAPSNGGAEMGLSSPFYAITAR